MPNSQTSKSAKMTGVQDRANDAVESVDVSLDNNRAVGEKALRTLKTLTIDALFPEMLIVMQPIGNLKQRCRLEPAGPPLSVASANNQPCIFQHFEVLADGSHAHGEWSC